MKVTRIEARPFGKKQAMECAGIAFYEFRKKNAEKLVYLGGGSFGRAVKAEADGKSIVIKFLRADDMLGKEVSDLKLLAEHCSIKMPSVLFVRKADKKIPVDLYAMEKIEGKPMLFSLRMLLSSKKRRLQIADEITSALHTLHACTSDKFGDTLNPAWESWLDFYRPFAQDVLREAEKMYSSGALGEKVITAMRAAWEKFDLIFSEKVTRACLIHGDLNVGNIMTDKGKISGIIDPLNSMYADREYDLFQFDNLTGKHFYLRETYVKKYGASKYCKQKLAFYGLWNEVYCYIRSGVYVSLIVNPLVKNMHKRLEEL